MEEHSEHKKEHKAEHKVHKHVVKVRKSALIPIVVVALAVLLLASVLTGGFGIKLGGLSKDAAAKKAVDFLNTNVLSAQGISATIKSVSVSGDLYNVKLDISGQEYNTFVTKNGKLFFPSSISLEQEAAAAANANTPAQQQPTQVQKSDKPNVKLFVMSYCPYGLQAEKALIPAYNLLKDKADITINFVSYAMHGKKEIDENLRQYCIQKEQPTKFWGYLTCFVQSGNYDDCFAKAGVDKAKAGACMTRTDVDFEVTKLYNDQSTWLSGSYPQFNVEKDLATKYGVQGSPTLVINDAEANADRSPEGMKKAICAAFNTEPAECQQTLSTAAAAPGVGALTATGSETAASCG